MSDIEDDAFRSLLELVQEIAKHHPRKKRRWKWLQKNQPNLWNRIRQNEHFDRLLDEEEITAFWYPDEFHQTINSDHINKLFTEIAYDDQEESDANF